MVTEDWYLVLMFGIGIWDWYLVSNMRLLGVGIFGHLLLRVQVPVVEGSGGSVLRVLIEVS